MDFFVQGPLMRALQHVDRVQSGLCRMCKYNYAAINGFVACCVYRLIKALLEEGTLNPSPGKVRDPMFQENEFFDPRDLVQVKYEMLRRVSVEKASVTGATNEYGVSRPTY